MLTFASGPNGLHVGSLKFVAMAYDVDGVLLSSIDQTIDAKLTPESYALMLKDPVAFRQSLDLPAGPMFLRLAVHDLTSDHIGSLEVPLIVDRMKAP